MVVDNNVLETYSQNISLVEYTRLLNTFYSSVWLFYIARDSST